MRVNTPIGLSCDLFGAEVELALICRVSTEHGEIRPLEYLSQYGSRYCYSFSP
jgi:hypothetical protein